MKRKFAKVIVKWRKIVNKFNGRSSVQKDQLQDAVKIWQKKQVCCVTYFTIVKYITQALLLIFFSEPK